MTAPISLDPVVISAAQGLTNIVEYGLLGSIAAVCMGIAALLVWVILKQAKDCHEGTKKSVDNNTEALNGIRIGLAEIKVMLDR